MWIETVEKIRWMSKLVIYKMKDEDATLLGESPHIWTRSDCRLGRHSPLHSGTMGIGLKSINDDFLDKHIYC